MYTIKKRRLNNSGDTIVEVLIVLAILSLSFAISYATASAGLNKAQTAQEHSQGLGLLNSQLELLRKAISANNPNVYNTSGFCMDITKNPSDPAAPVPIVSPYPALCQDQNHLFSYKITYVPQTPVTKSYFNLEVDWDGAGSLGAQQENLTYKIQPVSASISGAAYQGGSLGVQYVNNTAPPSPPPPPPTPTRSFNWLVAGSGYSTCASGETVVGDGNDGCKITSSSVYARRLVNITFNIPASSGVDTGTAKLKINYNQYSAAGSTPPAGYTGFSVSVKLIEANNSSVTLGTYSLPIEAQSNASWTARDFIQDINIPNNNIKKIEIDWLNNPGVDPDLQINSVNIYTP